MKNSALAGGMLAVSPLLGNCNTLNDYDFPLTDMHVHRTDKFTINNIIDISKSRKVRFGIVEHPAPWSIVTDSDLKNYIKINDMSRTPHEKFINMAREQGLKFAFGSDSRNQNAGRLSYCKSIAKKCNLKKENFYIPARNIDA